MSTSPRSFTDITKSTNSISNATDSGIFRTFGTSAIESSPLVVFAKVVEYLEFDPFERSHCSTAISKQWRNLLKASPIHLRLYPKSCILGEEPSYPVPGDMKHIVTVFGWTVGYLSMEIREDDDLSNFLSCFPAVTTLRIDNPRNYSVHIKEHISVILQRLPRLKHLIIPHMDLLELPDLSAMLLLSVPTKKETHEVEKEVDVIRETIYISLPTLNGELITKCKKCSKLEYRMKCDHIRC
jgi:hypothetical protein